MKGRRPSGENRQDRGGPFRKEAAMSDVAVVAMDIHKRFSKAVAMAADGRLLEESRIAHGDRGEMERYFSRFDPGTDVVMEATFNWPWIADCAEEMGLTPHLAHARRLREYAKGLPKTDRKDAIFQGKVWLAGDIFPESYLAPAPVRRMRALFRLRLLWVRMRTMLKNNVHGQLFKLGLVLDDEVSDLFSPKGRSIITRLSMQSEDRQELERKLAVIDALSEHITELDRQLEKTIKRDARADLLLTIPGIGRTTGYAILAEVGDFGRFPNGRALASYAGLLPIPRESADHEFERKTSSACNKFLRWAFLETVNGAIQSSSRMRSLHARVRARNATRAGKARVAVAREIAELAHLLVVRGVKYEEVGLSHRGRRRKAAMQ
jgi:transposase